MDRIAPAAKATRRPGADADLGGFGGLFDLKAAGFKDPVLVASTDGVGTKLKIAIDTGEFRGIGQDLVAMCVNDLVVQGAEPLFFLDYYATGKLDVEAAAIVISGIAQACKDSGCALIGGETAEMPGMYSEGEYDLAGFIVGAAERSQLLTGQRIRRGDVLLALPSSGLHTNGYSLARRLLFERAGYGPRTVLPELGGTLADCLLSVHRSYLKPIRALMAAGLLRGAAHITGGGITDNTPRMLPPGLAAVIETGSWKIPPIFEILRRIGNIPEDDYRRTFNLGVGMILAVAARSRAQAEAVLRRTGESPIPIGSVAEQRRRGPRVEYR